MLSARSTLRDRTLHTYAGRSTVCLPLRPCVLLCGHLARAEVAEAHGHIHAQLGAVHVGQVIGHIVPLPIVQLLPSLVVG